MEYQYMNYKYRTTDEFMDAYVNGTLNEFNEKLYGDYIDFNFESADLFDYYNVDLQYKNGCDCLKYNEDPCKCGNDISYCDDKFMWNKIPMTPKNMKFQKYYEEIFPKRIFKNKIFYWNDYDFFNYSPFSEFKIFLSKNEPITIWLGENPIYDEILPENLRIVFHGFDHINEIKIQINGVEYTKTPSPWEIIEFPVSSQNITEIIFTYNNNTVNFTEKYNDIMMNQIYYNHRP